MKSFFLIGFLIVLARSASLHMENDARNNNNNMNEKEKMDEKRWGDEEEDNKVFERIQSKRTRGQMRMQQHAIKPVCGGKCNCEEKCALDCLDWVWNAWAYSICFKVCYEKN